MLLLAFDTATAAVTVALHDGTRVVAQETAHRQMAQGELLAPLIGAVLEQVGARPADLTDVAVGVGPGPFTGLRVGVVTARTLAHTLSLRTHGVCSLDPIAAQAVSEGVVDQEFVVATDARRKEVYWARYDRLGHRLGDPQVNRPDVVADLGLPVLGRGAEVHADVLHPLAGPLDPSAGHLAALVVAGAAPILPLEPLYLRRPDATPQVPVGTR